MCCVARFCLVQVRRLGVYRAASVPATSAGNCLHSVVGLDTRGKLSVFSTICSLIASACSCGFQGVSEDFSVVVELGHTAQPTRLWRHPRRFKLANCPKSLSPGDDCCSRLLSSRHRTSRAAMLGGLLNKFTARSLQPFAHAAECRAVLR